MAWIRDVEGIATELIKEGFVGFRETLRLKDAIVEMDNLGGRRVKSGYFTNLGLLNDKLIADQSGLVKRIVEKFEGEIPTWGLDDDDELCILDASEIWINQAPKLKATRLLIEKFTYKQISSPIPSTKTKLILVSTEHNQRLVDRWREKQEQVIAVMVILGTRREHIRVDLGLPSDIYFPVISQETLKNLDEDIRKNMIPERLKKA